MKSINSMTFGRNNDNIFDQLRLMIEFQNISSQRRKSGEKIIYFDPIRLDNDRNWFNMDRWIIKISSKQKKQKDGSYIILIKNR